jgi:hypothetical protein
MALFRRAVDLLDPMVRRVLEEADAVFLLRTGHVEFHPVPEGAGGDAEARWELSWPEQRAARNVRGGVGLGPVPVVAWSAAGLTHPHLRGSRAGNWPLQVVDEADARRQEPILRAIVEAELHGRIFEGLGRIIPAASPPPGNG